MKAKKKGSSFIGKLLLWINIFLCICILVSYLAPVVNPAKFWPVAFFGLAYPYLLLANVIFIFYWLIRRRLWVFISVICIVIGWKILNKNIGLRFSSSPTYLAGSNMLRVMTYNVHNFKRYGSKNDISTKKEILQIIKDEQPDVIGIQEFYSRNKGQYDMLDSIQRILNCNNFYFMSVVSNKDEAIGMALFSKFPIVSRGMIQLASSRASENQCIYADINKSGKTFRFYSVHLQSIRFDPEDYRYLNNVEPQQGKPEGSAMRLVAKLKNAFVKRSQQVFKIREHAAACPYPYLITGDFNDTPTSFAVNQMAKGLKNAFVEKGSGLGRTYNGSFPNYQIDYVMTSPQFDVVDYHVIEKRLSDHYPVRSDVVLK